VKLKISGQQDAQGLEIPHRGRLERLFTSILAVAIGFNKSVALVIAVLKKKKALADVGLSIGERLKTMLQY
jgi:hypothetical protein